MIAVAISQDYNVDFLKFILIFKLGEAFLGRMSIQFYREVGFSNDQIAEYSKLIGWGATMAFTLKRTAPDDTHA